MISPEIWLGGRRHLTLNEVQKRAISWLSISHSRPILFVFCFVFFCFWFLFSDEGRREAEKSNQDSYRRPIFALLRFLLSFFFLSNRVLLRFSFSLFFFCLVASTGDYDRGHRFSVFFFPNLISAFFLSFFFASGVYWSKWPVVDWIESHSSGWLRYASPPNDSHR